ncbi:helix-turn-helix domain-containing protein [Mycobacterium sp. pR1184]|uniref:helix-turn-helix domain-containing protein n=1 Tax=Mycobacterium sp. pR1184 TaxID=3238981 RepID=UPI00351B8F7C
MRRGVVLDVSEAAVLADTIEDLCRRTGRQPSGRLGPIVAKLRKVVANTDGLPPKSVSFVGIEADSSSHCAYDLCTSAEAARILRISAHGVRDLRRRGVLAGHYTGTRWLYPLRVVEARAERQAARRAG